MKHAALAKCFTAEFEKQPFVLRKRMNIFLKFVYFLNLCLLLFGMGWINYQQNCGAFHSTELMVTFGDQIWSDAIVTLPSGEEVTRTLLFSYFNGEKMKAIVGLIATYNIINRRFLSIKFQASTLKMERTRGEGPFTPNKARYRIYAVCAL